MSATAIADALVGQLRALPDGTKPHMGEIRRAIGCTNAELKQAVDRLRFAGKLHWERIELAPSMLLDAVSDRGGEGAGQAAATIGEQPVSSPSTDSAGDIPPTAEEEAARVSAPPPRTPRAGQYRHDEGQLARSKQRNETPRLPAPAGGGVAAEVAREAEANVRRRREVRRSTSLTALEVSRGVPLTLPEQIQTLLTETPADVILAVQRKHPVLWRRAIAVSRLRGEMPAASLFEAIARGLSSLEREDRGAAKVLHGAMEREVGL